MVIGISGNLATGKTTLLNRIAEDCSNINIKIEQPENNPYLHLIDNNDNALLGFELHYLLSCVDMYQAANKIIGTTCVERTLEENRMFAKKTLKTHDFVLYERVFNIACKSVPCQINGIIFLDASLDTIYKNIARRNCSHLDTPRLTEYPKLFFAEYKKLAERYTNAHNAIVINMDSYDIFDSDEDRFTVLKMAKDFIESIKV